MYCGSWLLHNRLGYVCVTKFMTYYQLLPIISKIDASVYFFVVSSHEFIPSLMCIHALLIYQLHELYFYISIPINRKCDHGSMVHTCP